MPKQRRLGKGATRLRCIEGTSNKFYDILVHQEGDEWCYTAHYGRIVAAGSFQTKGFSTHRAACTAADKMVLSKLAKGYYQVTDPDAHDHAATLHTVAATTSAPVVQVPVASTRRRKVVRD
jgi:predicted DNA-binding WGR domain protein